MFFLRKPGSAKYEQSAVKFISLFGKITDILNLNDNDSNIDKLFSLIDIPDDKYDVFVGIVATLNMDKSPGFLAMKSVSHNMENKTYSEKVDILKSLRNSELIDIIVHCNRSLDMLKNMMALVDDKVVEEPLSLFVGFIRYITLIKKIKFGKTSAQPRIVPGITSIRKQN